MDQPIAEMSKSDYAARAGVSKGRISQLTKQGALLAKAVTPTGKINVAVADRLRGIAYDPSNNQSRPPPKLPSPAEATDPDEDDEDQALLLRSRASAAEADAEWKHLRNHEKAGRLVDRAAFGARQADRLKVLFDTLRGSKNAIVDRLITDHILPGDKQIEARAAIASEIEKLIEDWRSSLKKPTDA
ncbi:hypothetical protein [Parvibaculum sp.]|uniref:hypothetical protein n=1 Tax=Parvibaculum sp. TaxID=2024848 RepID=UPI0027305250|nr:hypothetical protein [Parvibaculum sp.]MDP1628846.1 hypothetical protein [Parvibaculum sp.]MDP2148241.1 hypothetical protein [Parvibaculum sp.]MDP3327853.1 hypothetical protein [Parvibaculum sp.]